MIHHSRGSHIGVSDPDEGAGFGDWEATRFDPSLTKVGRLTVFTFEQKPLSDLPVGVAEEDPSRCGWVMSRRG